MTGLDFFSPTRRAWPLVTLVLTMAACKGDGPAGPAGPQGAPGEQGPGGDPGDDAVSALAVMTSLERGDEVCAFGGTIIDTGLDNGDGGGTAGDGILQGGEIDATDVVCDGPNSMAAQGFEEPGGAAGTAVLDLRGGDGAVGGEGGYLDARIEAPTGGNILFATTGQADASFTMPDLATHANFGSSKLLVPGGTTVTIDRIETGIPPAPGTYFQQYSNSEIYLVLATRGGPSLQQVSGIEVQAGGTLVLEGYYGNSQASVFVDYDIRNAGTITVTRYGSHSPGLSLNSEGNYFGLAGSKIDLTGLDGTNGGYGGNLYIDLDGSVVGGRGTSSFLNLGMIDTSGGTGQMGAEGGDVEIYANLRLMNGGAIDTSAGASTASSGSSAGDVDLYGSFGVYNSGAITANGGAGAEGGAGGEIELGAFQSLNGDLAIGGGAVVNSGPITANGGDVAGTCTYCYAGYGGYLWMGAGGDDVRTNAPISLRGGDGGEAGPGGELGVYTYTATGGEGSGQGKLPAGGIYISNTIDLSGGDGDASGGEGGGIYASVDASSYYGGPSPHFPNLQSIQFLGYQSADLRGGDASEDWSTYYGWSGYGCSGGWVRSYIGTESDPSLPGVVANYIDLDTSGGANSNTADWEFAGEGGSVELRVAGAHGEGRMAFNYGEIVADGGVGAEGSSGGWIGIAGVNRAENHGDISALGGAATEESGGWGGSFSLAAWAGHASNTADVDTSGGAGGPAPSSEGYGGGGGTATFVGDTVDNSGALAARGGNAASTGEAPGHGGRVELLSRVGFSVNTGTANIDAGTGGEFSNDEGAFYIDDALIDGTAWESER